MCCRVFAKVKSRSAHMKIHRPDQDKEKEKKAKLAKQQLAAANAKMEAAKGGGGSVYDAYNPYSNMNNSPYSWRWGAAGWKHLAVEVNTWRWSRGGVTGNLLVIGTWLAW